MPLPSFAKNGLIVKRPGHDEVEVDVLLQVAQADRRLVLAADADVVEHLPSVGRNADDAEVRVLAAGFRGVDHDLVLASRIDLRGPCARILRRRSAHDGRQLLAGPAQREELILARLVRVANGGRVDQLAQPPPRPLPLRRLTDDQLGVLVLPVDEGAGLRAFLVLQPPVGILELDAVERLGEGDLFRLGRRRIVAAAGREAEEKQADAGWRQCSWHGPGSDRRACQGIRQGLCVPVESATWERLNGSRGSRHVGFGHKITDPMATRPSMDEQAGVPR